MPAATASFRARQWRMLPDDRLECQTCPRRCHLRAGQRGFCFVRQREGDELILATYGRSSGFCIDPIEKKPLHHFLPGTPVLSFGTAGCNLGCRFCQNWDLSKSREIDTLCDEATPEQIAAAAEQYHCRSVAFTYNDPVVFWEYALDVAQACHARGLKTVAVTNGYMSLPAAAEFYAHIDAANVDLKAFSESFYAKHCLGRLAPVLELLQYLHRQTSVWVELTTLLIPGLNDSDAELDALTRWVVAELGPDVPIHFTAFHPDYQMLDVPHTPLATLARAQRLATRNGIRFAYTGNVNDKAGESTYCYDCGNVLIDRNWYELHGWALTAEACCRHCGMPVPGVFEAEPGTWGRQRRPIRVGNWL